MGIFWCFSEELSNSIYSEANVSIFIKVLSPLIVLMYIDNIVDGILKGLDKQVAVMGINILDLFLLFYIQSAGNTNCILILVYFLSFYNSPIIFNLSIKFIESIGMKYSIS